MARFRGVANLPTFVNVKAYFGFDVPFIEGIMLSQNGWMEWVSALCMAISLSLSFNKYLNWTFAWRWASICIYYYSKLLPSEVNGCDSRMRSLPRQKRHLTLQLHIRHCTSRPPNLRHIYKMNVSQRSPYSKASKSSLQWKEIDACLQFMLIHFQRAMRARKFKVESTFTALV